MGRGNGHCHPCGDDGARKCAWDALSPAQSIHGARRQHQAAGHQDQLPPRLHCVQSACGGQVRQRPRLLQRQPHHCVLFAFRGDQEHQLGGGADMRHGRGGRLPVVRLQFRQAVRVEHETQHHKHAHCPQRQACACHRVSKQEVCVVRVLGWPGCRLEPKGHHLPPQVPSVRHGRSCSERGVRGEHAAGENKRPGAAGALRGHSYAGKHRPHGRGCGRRHHQHRRAGPQDDRHARRLLHKRQGPSCVLRAARAARGR
mmetsp:Transcript_16472/g.42172  ORF Transcript_16472/g.42172 Transcript_16472/m.42172 type:complete len:257 (-) Transcript_16472:341-1111(-)